MKKCSLFIFCISTLLISSCSKNETPEIQENPDKTELVKVATDLEDGRREVEIKTVNITAGKVMAPVPLAVNAFDIPEEKYIKATCLLDFSKVHNRKSIDTLTDKTLGIKFSTKMRKLNGYPDGWTAKWGEKPNVEHETPPVLYTIQKNTLSIILSKPCTIFGFELAPNLYNTFEFTAGFYSRYENPPYARVTRQVTTPSGALLFAVESDKPFDDIEIQFTGDLNGDIHPFGFAIANIRYKLAK